MPLFPGEKPEFLEATLNCLNNQTLKADEFLIAADGPLPQRLIEIINNCNLPISLYSFPFPRGIGSTLAEAALMCKGHVIIRIDSDDIYAPVHTENLIHGLNTNKNLGVIGCQLLEIDSDGNNQFSTRKTPISYSIARKWLPWRNPLNHQTVAIRRLALEKAGGYRDCPGFEDWDLWLRIVEAGYQISSLSSCTVAARVNKKHRERRKGYLYAKKELKFYRTQIRESRINLYIGLIACIIRLPWRILPSPIMSWWMQSQLRGSPTLKASWITKSFLNEIR